MLRDVRGDGGDVRRFVEPQGPAERPPALRHLEAVAVGMQMCSAPRQLAPRVRDQGSLDRDDTQQFRLRGTAPAAHASAHRFRTRRHARV